MLKISEENRLPIIYGDSFYIEAIQKLLGNEFLFW